MTISFNTLDVSSIQNRNHPNQSTGRPASSAPVISQTSQTTEDEHTQPLTGRPVQASGAPSETKHSAPSSEPNRNVTTGSQLSEADKQQIEQLRVRDRQVRAHEQAHLSAAGGLAKGGASFSTQTGPDGKLYAVGGEVSVDTSSVSNDPEATIAKAQQVRRAALAPADPSAQDIAVAAQATIQEQDARAELREILRAEEERGVTEASHAEEGGASTNVSQSKGAETTYRNIELQREEPTVQNGNTLDLFA